MVWALEGNIRGPAGPQGPPGPATLDAASGVSPLVLEGVTSMLSIVPQGAETNGITIKAPNQAWGKPTEQVGGVPYGKGQAFEILSDVPGPTVLPDDRVIFRIDARGGLGTGGGMHIATGLRRYPDEPIANQAVWVNPYTNTAGIVIHSPTVANSASWTMPYMTVVDTRTAGTPAVFAIEASGLTRIKQRLILEAPDGVDAITINKPTGTAQDPLRVNRTDGTRQIGITREGWLATFNDAGTQGLVTLNANNAALFGFRAYFQAGNAAVVPLVVRGETGQTGELVQFQPVSATTAAAVGPSGEFRAHYGSQAFPGISYYGDNNSGIHRSAEDELTMVTGGTIRQRWNSDGRVQLNRTDGTALLDMLMLSPSTPGLNIKTASGTLTAPPFRIQTAANADVVTMDGNGGITTRGGGAGYVFWDRTANAQQWVTYAVTGNAAIWAGADRMRWGYANTTSAVTVLPLSGLSAPILDLYGPGVQSTLWSVSNDGVTNLGAVGGTQVSGPTNNIGDKIALYQAAAAHYGFGIQASALVAYITGGAFQVRNTAAAGQKSSGTVAHSFYTAGQASIGGSFPAVAGIAGPALALLNITTPPTGNPVGGGILYAEAGALKWRGSSGTVTQLAAA